METDLIMNHHRLVRILEMEYQNHICKLLKQKSLILDNLQQQFIERRNRIKLIFANQRDIKREQYNIHKEAFSIFSKPIDASKVLLSSTVINNCEALSVKKEAETSVAASSENKHASNENMLEQKKKKTKRYKSKAKIKCDRPKNKIHKCPHCEYASDVKTNLKRHIRTHTGEKPFACNYGGCKKKFACSSALNDHIKRHIGDKRFKCSFCSKKFVTKAEMTSHSRVHTGEKPFGCPPCKERFRNRNAMRLHIKQGH